MHNYDKLKIYQDSLELAKGLFRSLEDFKCYALRDQILKSAVSIPSNIAEGCQRNSKQDFTRFLSYAKGSAAELLTQLTILKESRQAETLEVGKLIESCFILNKMLQAFIQRQSKEQ